MSETNGTQQKEKATKIRRKPERESILTPTFAANRHSTSGSLWDRNQQGSGLLQRQCACGTHTIGGGECDACRQKGEGGFLQRTAIKNIPDHFPTPEPPEHQNFPPVGIGHNFSHILLHGPNEERALPDASTAGETLAYVQGSLGVFDKIKETRTGVDTLSGVDSPGRPIPTPLPNPVQRKAAADKQGPGIRVGSEHPGQQRRIPQTSWRGGPPMPGRVAPKLQIQQMSLNDDVALEREADGMAAKPLQMTHGGRLSPIQGNATTGALQRFDTREHEAMGNLGSNRKMVELAPGYRITYGEMVAMAGDHFESIEQMRQFAKKRSGKESRMEIEYVREKWLKKKGRKYDDEAKKSATKRYYTLAARNRSHFVNPDKGDEQRSTKEKAKMVRQVKGVAVPQNSIAGYRLNHVKAIREAAIAGAAGGSIAEALAADAFASHYLTDSFSSGHVRVPREEARRYWNAKVPMFFHNLQGYMAERIAEELRKTNAEYQPKEWYKPDIYYSNLTEQIVYEGTLKELSKAFKSKSPVNFGDLVGLALHDWDNKRGLKATIAGEDVELFGDSLAGTGDEKKYAIQAVELSVQDIERAYTDGLVGIGNSEQLLLGPDGLYDAERLIPQAKKENKRIPWKYDSPLALLKNKHFKKALRVFAINKAKEISSVTEKFDQAQQQALKTGIIDPLLKSPANVVWWVINWTPQTGGGVGGHDTDDNAQAYYKKAARTRGGLQSLTPIQRIKLIRDLDAGYITFNNEEKAIWNILNTARDADARQVIKAVGWGKIASALEGAEDRKFRKRFPKAKYGR